MAKLQAGLYRAAVYLGLFFSVGVLVMIVGYILVKGIPHLSTDLFAWKYNSNNVSMLPSMINTLLMTILALFVCVPLGIGAAIYLTEYARRGSKLVKLVRMTAETLSGIPSIIYGLFGALFFVVALKMGLSLLSGALTLSIMVLPTIIRTTEEALLAVLGLFVEQRAHAHHQQRLRDADALTVAFGQVLDEPPKHALQLDDAADLLNVLCARQLAFFEIVHKIQILAHRHIRIQRRQFRQITDARFGGVGIGQNVVTVDGHHAVGRRQIAGQNVHRGGFTGTVRTEKTDDLAFLDRKADVIHRRVRSVPFGQIFDLDHSGMPPFM